MQAALLPVKTSELVYAHYALLHKSVLFKTVAVVEGCRLTGSGEGMGDNGKWGHFSFWVRWEEAGEQRAPMWLELNVYHARGQWVTYFQQCSFIRVQIYKLPAPTPLLFVLADVRQPVAFNSRVFFVFGVGVDPLWPDYHVLLILRIEPRSAWNPFSNVIYIMVTLWAYYRTLIITDYALINFFKKIYK